MSAAAELFGFIAQQRSGHNDGKRYNDDNRHGNGPNFNGYLAVYVIVDQHNFVCLVHELTGGAEIAVGIAILGRNLNIKVRY